MNSLGISKIAGLFLLVSIGVTGCSISRSMIVNDKKVIMQGLYEVDPPSQDWQGSVRGTFSSESSDSARINDIVFTSCPGPKLIVISRAVYRTGMVMTKKWSEEMSSRSFENIALCYLDEFYSGLKNREKGFAYEIVSHRNIQVGRYNAVEAICKTKELFKDCDGQRKATDLTNKFILIEGGDQSAFLDWGLKSPRMIVFWYGSPVEYYEDGLKDFEQMVQSFRFIKE